MNKQSRKSAKDVATPADDRFGVLTDWLQLVPDRAPYGADELARLAAALLPESVKQELVGGDLWPYFEEGYFPPIRELDNAIAAAVYILSRSCEKTILKQEEHRYRQEELEEFVPFIKSAKEITQEKRADRAEAKLAEFLVALEGSEAKTRHFEVWRKRGISGRDVFTFKVLYTDWKISKKTSCSVRSDKKAG